MHILKEKYAIESIKWIKKHNKIITLKSELEEQKATKEKISHKPMSPRLIRVNNKRPDSKLFSSADSSSYNIILSQKIIIPKQSEIILIEKKTSLKLSLKNEIATISIIDKTQNKIFSKKE